MIRYIKVDDLLNELHKYFPNDGFYEDKYWNSMHILSAIRNTQTADVRENVHGEWVGTGYDGYADGYPVFYEWECSACGCTVEDEEPTWNFCPNCGADMRKEVE